MKIENVPLPKAKRAKVTKPKIKATVKPDLLANGLVLGELVSYYDEGWRIGHLEEVKKTLAWVIPIGGYKAAKKRAISVPLEDVRRVND